MGMFDHVLARKQSIPRWVAPALAAAILFHACALSGAIVHGYWDVDALPLPKGRVELVVPAPAPPPPAARGSSAPRPKDAPTRHVRQATDPTQPLLLKDQAPTPIGGSGASTGGAGNGIGPSTGVTTGAGDCVGITCVGDDSEPPITRKQEDKVRNEPIAVVDQHFLSGERDIHPDDATRTKMSRDGVRATRVVVKMCLSADGEVTRLDLLTSSGYPEYDARIRATMRTWRYSAFGGDTTVCSPVTFLYNIK